MVNKEFIIGNGNIVKDFTDRNISQYSNNSVCVSVLIPTSLLNEFTNYSIEMAFSKKVGSTITTLPSLICSNAKTIKVDGIEYIKWSCILSISYTNFIGQLLMTPYIVETTTTLIDGVEQVVITKQSTNTNTTLNVIKAIDSTNDASLEEAEAVDTLTALLNAKNIMLINDYVAGTESQAVLGCFTDYNASFYNGWLLIVKYSGGEFALLPYKNESDNEFTKITLDGKFSRLFGYTDTPNETYNETQLTYTKAQIDTILENYYTKAQVYNKTETDSLLDGKVSKTQKINGKALSSDVDLDKSDIGLGNVENYDTINSPSENATTSWVRASGLWTYLITNYADKSDYDSTKAKVNELYDSFKGTSDNDNIVNTLYDLIKVFENFPESDNIASVLSGLDSRLDDLEELSNTLITINGTITLDDANWVSNSGDYSTDYPYIITYQNDYLKGVENFDVVFAVDSDTSLLSTTATLNDATGTITFYAKAIPSADIEIEKIVAVSTIGAINPISAEIVNQVNQNKNDIADLKTGVVYKEYTSTSGIYGIKYQQNAISLDARTTQQTRKSGHLSLYNFLFSLLFYTDESTPQNFNLQVGRVDNTDKVAQFKNFAKLWRKINDVNYDIPYINDGTTIDATQETYSRSKIDALLSNAGGGGSTLYQHNISVQYSGCYLTIKIINDNSTAIDRTALQTFLTGKFTGYNKGYGCSGGVVKNGTLCPAVSLYLTGSTMYIGIMTASGNDEVAFSGSPSIFEDVVIAL